MRTTEHVSSPTASQAVVVPAVEAAVGPCAASYDSTHTVIKTDCHRAVALVKVEDLDLVK